VGSGRSERWEIQEGRELRDLRDGRRKRRGNWINQLFREQEEASDESVK
jgi:hypothetical protein